MTTTDHFLPVRKPKLWRFLAAAILISMTATTLALWFGGEYRRAEKANAAIQNIYRRQFAAEAMFSALKDAETGQRGYIITGQPAFLKPYSVARREMRSRIDDLSRVINGDAEQQRRLNHIAALTERKFAEMQRVIDARDSKGTEQANLLISQGMGKRLMDAIRQSMSELKAANDLSLAARQQREVVRTDRSELIIWIGVLLIALSSTGAAFLLWKSRQERYRATGEAHDLATRQKAIFENAFNAIILINPSGSVEILNASAERLFGYSATTLLRRDISVIVDIAPGDGPFLDRLGLNEEGAIAHPFRPLIQATRADGTTVPVEAALGLMPLEDGVHIVASFRDVSEREKIEKMKDQFLSTVSHELRTPLTSIVGSLGLLQGGAVAELAPAAQRLVTIAENNANRLIRIVNDLLDVEKLEKGKMTFEFHPLDLRRSVNSAIDAMRGLAATRDITLTLTAIEETVPVRGDSDRLIQVVTNLLSNAIRFSPRGATVKIHIDMNGNVARVGVTDAGPGIPADLRDRLFTRFAQGQQPADATIRGTGLGLTIAREIIRSHGGSIDFEDGPSGGTTFCFTIPMWNAITGQADLNGAPRLLIFADEGEAATIAAGFALRAIRADIVTSSEQTLRALGARPYLALVIDFQFAGEAALPLLHGLRAWGDMRGLPVIAIAGEIPPQSEAGHIAALDIIDWIPKPIAPESIDDAIAGAMARASVIMPLILHIDDDSDTLEITAAALGGIARIAQAVDLRSARAFLAQNQPDIIIIDIGLPDGSGLDLLGELSADGAPPVPIIIYSAQEGNADLTRDVEAVLTKSRRSLPNLIDTIQAIVDRQKKGEEA